MTRATSATAAVSSPAPQHLTSRLGDCPVGELERRARRDHTAAAVRDVCERPSVDEGRRPLARLYQVRRHGGTEAEPSR
jgi:hypothetical protein